jgi:hypothetical protein
MCIGADVESIGLDIFVEMEMQEEIRSGLGVELNLADESVLQAIEGDVDGQQEAANFAKEVRAER